MAQIQPVTFPIVGDATKLEVTILPFSTSATTAGTYYILTTEDGKTCLSGNYYLTEEEFAAWGQDNSYVDDIVAAYLGVTIVAE
jgi:hypothetical protein